MFAMMSVHTPHPEHRDALIDSMHRFGAAMRGHPGLISVHTLEDERSGRLVGLALFESEEAAERLAPLARAAVADDDFDTWEAVDPDGLRLTEI
ncbi:hypothetical protein GCM10011512_02620 [Tersicoccus solisilvae]|uniref:ABM domain-containing protein n=1 Tax=Tersicoccus solisilvae TaxID=1882339 RepID=A0ABQ1NPP1_9MICC|nr:antibiotic biosynthesis monooxygenase [Tersicoccus solisilvae]GGC79448.1 hypothetical protein GCM10011512_02620 [Tersicoccus solisilvae]